MDSNLIISNAFTLLLFIISGFLLYYFYPYLTKKGQNKADIQDSAQLTKIIESVKSEFSSKIELLRTDLQLMSNYRIEHRNEERKAIIEFHQYYNEWVNKGFMIDVVAYNLRNCPELLSKRTDLMGLNEKCILAQSKVELLVKNPELIALCGKLVLEGIKFSNYSELFLMNLYYNLSNRDSYIERFIEIYKELEYKEEAQRLADDSTKAKNETDVLIRGWLNSKVERYSPITSILDEFNKLAKTYLTEIH